MNGYTFPPPRSTKACNPSRVGSRDKLPQGHFHTESFIYFGQQAHGLDGISAQLEKVLSLHESVLLQNILPEHSELTVFHPVNPLTEDDVPAPMA